MVRLLMGLLLVAVVWTGALTAAIMPRGESLRPLAKQAMEATHAQWPGSLDYLNSRVNSDQTAQLQNEEQACINPQDLQNYVAVWRDFRLGYRRVGTGYSTNGGGTWTDGLLPDMFYPWQSDPLLVVSDSGVFTAMVISFDPMGEDGLLQVTSRDGGRSWRDSVWAVNAVQPVGFEDKEMLAQDNSPASPWHGSLYCAWTHFYGYDPYDSTHIWLTVKRPGLPYGPPHVLSARTSNQWANVCTGPNGEVYVSWCGFQSNGLMFTRSMDGGDSWTAPWLIETTNFLSTEINPVLWIFAYGALAADISDGPYRGRLYMVFTDTDDIMAETDIFLKYSDNGGDTWTMRQQLNDEPVAITADQFHPWISVDEEGRVWVAFYDRRNDPNNILMDLYFTVSTDGGASWRPNERITSVSSDPGAGTLDAGLIGEYIGWSAQGGKALAVWTDTRLGNQDVYSATIDTLHFSAADDRGPRALPASIRLAAYPNPTNGAVKLRYTLDHAAPVTLRLYNTLGQTVLELAPGQSAAGEHETALELNGLASGLYIAEIQSVTQTARAKVMLLK